MCFDLPFDKLPPTSRRTNFPRLRPSIDSLRQAQDRRGYARDRDSLNFDSVSARETKQDFRQFSIFVVSSMGA